MIFSLCALEAKAYVNIGGGGIYHSTKINNKTTAGNFVDDFLDKDVKAKKNSFFGGIDVGMGFKVAPCIRIDAEIGATMGSKIEIESKDVLMQDPNTPEAAAFSSKRAYDLQKQFSAHIRALLVFENVIGSGIEPFLGAYVTAAKFKAGYTPTYDMAGVDQKRQEDSFYGYGIAPTVGIQFAVASNIAFRIYAAYEYYGAKTGEFKKEVDIADGTKAPASSKVEFSPRHWVYGAALQYRF